MPTVSVPFIPDNAPVHARAARLAQRLSRRPLLHRSSAGPGAEPPSVAQDRRALCLAVRHRRRPRAQGRQRTQGQRPRRLACLAGGLHARGALAEERYAILIASTYGEGEAPDAVRPFYEQLCLEHFPRLRKSLLLRPRAGRFQLRALLQIRHRPRQQTRLARRNPHLRSRSIATSISTSPSHDGRQLSTPASTRSSPHALPERADPTSDTPASSPGRRQIQHDACPHPRQSILRAPRRQAPADARDIQQAHPAHGLQHERLRRHLRGRRCVRRHPAKRPSASSKRSCTRSTSAARFRSNFPNPVQPPCTTLSSIISRSPVSPAR